MSSILIKGMDMPKSCADCFFRQAAPNSLDVYFCYADKNNRYAVHDKRPLFCPLVEVPTPHGDLIDKEQLKQLLLDLWRSGCNYTISDLIREIVDIKPIIEAEE